MTLAPDDPRHGTLYGYNSLGCREECCRSVRRDYRRRVRSGEHVPRRYAVTNPHGKQRERDARARSSRVDAEYGCTVTFENHYGERLTLHREGAPERVLDALCDEALRIDATLRVVSYSTPNTVLADAQVRRHGGAGFVESTILGQIGRLEMLHPRIRGRSATAARRWRARDALAR